MRKTLFGTLLLAIGMLAVPVGFAQAPAGAPAGSTGLCNDGTYYSGATKQGACRGHKGVKQWWGGGSAAAAPAKAAKTKSAPAAAPVASQSAAPAGATGLCNDGTYYTGATKQGACRGHKGVKQWWGAESSKSPAPSTPAAATSMPAPMAASPAPSQSAAPASSRKGSTSIAAAPGGGPGLVWLNSGSNVYHCYGSQWYGKTKAGSYMSESEAKSKGAHPSNNRPCK